MEFYEKYVAQLSATLGDFPWQEMDEVVELLRDAWLANKQVFIMGNGGSASTATHIACDLGKNTAIPGVRRLRVMSLNDNMALFSAHGNDNGYDKVFAEQLRNFLDPEDVVVAISASGNSPNVLNAIERARSVGATTVGWSGYNGGRLAEIVDFPIIVRNDNIEQIEDIHLMFGHMVTIALRRTMRDEAMQDGNHNGRRSHLSAILTGEATGSMATYPGND